MSELYKIILTSAFTVLGGIIVLAFGQIITKLIIEPLQEQSKLIGEIASSLIFYANVGGGIEQHYYQEIKRAEEFEEPAKTITTKRYEQVLENHWKKCDEAAVSIRQQASKLIGVTNSIPLYGLWTSLKLVPKYENILNATPHLIGMSNATHGTRSTSDEARKIAELLNLNVVLEHFGWKESTLVKNKSR